MPFRKNRQFRQHNNPTQAPDYMRFPTSPCDYVNILNNPELQVVYGVAEKLIVLLETYLQTIYTIYSTWMSQILRWKTSISSRFLQKNDRRMI